MIKASSTRRRGLPVLLCEHHLFRLAPVGFEKAEAALTTIEHVTQQALELTSAERLRYVLLMAFSSRVTFRRVLSLMLLVLMNR